MKNNWNEITRSYMVDNDREIKGFFGKNRFLSNFELCCVSFEGLLYPSSENAYQAAKVSTSERIKFIDCNPSESKRLWKQCKTIYLPEQWDLVKYDIMSYILFEKFYRNLDLRQKLIETNNKYLEETNHWKDTYWGVDYKSSIGQNNLGKILMKLREFWRQ